MSILTPPPLPIVLQIYSGTTDRSHCGDLPLWFSDLRLAEAFSGQITIAHRQ